MNSSKPTRNLALEIARVTEAAALASGRWMGRGEKEKADNAAVEAMRLVLSSVDMDGVIVIGEGEKDNAPMLYNGEHVGNGLPPEMDVAVDPIDGTTPVAFGRTNGIATVAIAPRGSMFDPGPFVYMNKIAVGPQAKGKINVDAPVADNLKAIAKALGKSVEDLTTIVLDRPRHKDLVAEIRKIGRAHPPHPGRGCGRRLDDSPARHRHRRVDRHRRHARRRTWRLALCALWVARFRASSTLAMRTNCAEERKPALTSTSS